MLKPINAETRSMSQAQLEAYFEGCNNALQSDTCDPNKVYEDPDHIIIDAFRRGFAAQKVAMISGSSLV